MHLKKISFNLILFLFVYCFLFLFQRNVSPISTASTSGVNQVEPIDLSFISDEWLEIEHIIDEWRARSERNALNATVTSEQPVVDEPPVDHNSRSLEAVEADADLSIGAVTRARSKMQCMSSDAAMNLLLSMPNVTLEPIDKLRFDSTVADDSIAEPSYVLMDKAVAGPSNVLIDPAVPGPSRQFSNPAVPGPSRQSFDPAVPGPSRQFLNPVVPGTSRMYMDPAVPGTSRMFMEQFTPPSNMGHNLIDFGTEIDSFKPKKLKTEYFGDEPCFSDDDILAMLKCIGEAGSLESFADAFFRPKRPE